MTLERFQHVKQKQDNDSWLACAAMLEVYRRERTRTGTDDFSTDPSGVYNELRATYLHENRGIDEAALPQGNTFDFLINRFECPNYKIVIYKWAIPTFEQIKSRIDMGFPFVCFVKGVAPPTEFETEEKRYNYCQGDDGHSVIICGYDEEADGGVRKICVSDPKPDIAETTIIPYHQTQYRDGLYWWFTFAENI
ncbi:MAG: C39 family peptidase [Clostridiales bacterium]|jgi:hypothetical protein|nr:C39 family peptidase [Clostridiales bacterium]